MFTIIEIETAKRDYIITAVDYFEVQGMLWIYSKDNRQFMIPTDEIQDLNVWEA